MKRIKPDFLVTSMKHKGEKYLMGLLTNHTFIICILSALWFCVENVMATVPPSPSAYNLSISFEPENSRVTGTARITVPKNQKLTLSLYYLDITGTLLRDKSGREQALEEIGDMLILPPAPTPRTLFISYTRDVLQDPGNHIGTDGISLASNWYPVPENPVIFTLNATLPDNFTAITESDIFPLQHAENQTSSHFSRATSRIHFVAGPYQVDELQVRDGLRVYTMFFPEDRSLSTNYLKAAADYLLKYEKEIGPFPFNHYVIVADRLPSGSGMPGFTLLGQMVLRLPFIIKTSLRHEIVHSWFGNGVEVDYSHGNWCEGLTSYLSDYRYREDLGQGAASRKENIIRYLSYVHGNTTLKLSDFISGNHNQPMADSRRAVGYNRSALLFHELKMKIGSEAFGHGLQYFFKEFTGKRASWTDLEKSFETFSKTDLSPFFKERLYSIDIPMLDIDNLEYTSVDGEPGLHFRLTQKSEHPFSLKIPFQIQTMRGSLHVEKDVNAKSTDIFIPMKERPLELRIDPEYTMLRELTPAESTPTWSRFLGAEDKLVIVKDKDALEIYQPILDTFQNEELEIVEANETLNSELGGHNLIFLGLDQAPLYSLFGKVTHNEGVTVDVRKNPIAPGKVAVLLSSSSSKDSHMVARRLRHYGKYSFLEFSHGRKNSARVASSSMGMRFIIEELPEGVPSNALKSFTSIVEEIAANQVIYIGEMHTSLSDHLLQLRIIEEIHKTYPNVAIGMEMFPTSSQSALDEYTRGQSDWDEHQFLRKSDYFNVWRYDYRLYRDIIRFAKDNSLALIGLNLDRNIVSQVFREGNTDGLDKDILGQLPNKRDLTLPGYAERLALMHQVHQGGGHGNGAFAGFIQAQALWDETMASNIVKYLDQHPERKLIVLAGSQHTRKDSGIPPRVARRVSLKQASVLNLSNLRDATELSQQVDYYFTSLDKQLEDSPKIGVVLAPDTYKGKSALKVIQLSPHGKAGEAGIEVGDILLTLNGVPLLDMTELRIAMLDTQEGEKIQLEVVRGSGKKEQTKSLSVLLTKP
jgi:aminopeptidase N